MRSLIEPSNCCAISGLVVAHELSSGAALIPSVGAMYGEQAVSETALARDLFVQIPDDGIVMADAGFGSSRSRGLRGRRIATSCSA